MTKTALVLSGGGAFGAFQEGAERVARIEFGYTWDIIIGVSVGALNGAMLSMQKYDLLSDIWRSITPDQVYTGGFDVWNGFRFFVLGHKSFMDNAPLKRLIAQHWDAGAVKADLRIGVVSLYTGEYHIIRPSDTADFPSAVLASTAMPVVWEPTNVDTDDMGLLPCCVDGGVRNMSPLGDVVDDEDIDEIVVINCGNSSADLTGPCPRTGVEVAQRTLGILLDEIFQGDIQQFVFVNELVKQATAKGVTLLHPSMFRPLRYVPLRVIEPFRPLAGDVLDFDQTTIAENISIGEVSARMVLGKGG